MAWLFAVIGGSATIKPRCMRSLFLVGNPFEGRGWTGGTCPGTISIHFSCADLAPEALSVRLGFLTKHYIVDFLGKKKKRAFYDHTRRNNSPFDMSHHQ